MPYLIEGLDPAPYAPLFALGEEELAQQGAVMMVADEAPGYPCRVSLADAAPGTRMLLVNHVSRPQQGPYRTSHAIFVSEGAAAAGRFADTAPPVFVSRLVSLRGFDAAGMMVDALLAPPGEADAGLAALFADPRIVEVDVHTAVRGCFLARARRVGSVSHGAI
ncbi:MAG: DUF1203 domain-containing protein [Erythrobacter sp.]